MWGRGPHTGRVWDPPLRKGGERRAGGGTGPREETKNFRWTTGLPLYGECGQEQSLTVATRKRNINRGAEDLCKRILRVDGNIVAEVEGGMVWEKINSL